MSLKVCFITGSRAEYGLLYPLLKEMAKEKAFKTQLIVTGTHLLPEFGLTYKEIKADGFRITRKVRIPLSNDSEKGVTMAAGHGVIRFADALASLKPDMVIVLGDRFEIFAAVVAAFMSRIPVVHLHGGELTEGVLDDAFRHSITKMSMLHFVANEEYRKRVIQLGESPERVFNVGAIGIDNIRHATLLTRRGFEKEMKFTLGAKTALVTFHPVTLEKDTARSHIRALMRALDAFKEMKVIFTMPNADAGRSEIVKAVDRYVREHPHKAVAFSSMGRLKYLSAVANSDVVVGNSSSGIIEVPALGKPSVNIGDRQRGRIKAASVIDCTPDSKSIIKALDKALSPSFQKMAQKARNPYGDGTAARKIMDILKKRTGANMEVKKEFYTI
jgi:GDP/UDP-N,N'-diacetylbacillosamine 2-epimerase (hydrolysing)